MNSDDPAWPDTLRGKARELHERDLERAKPRGFTPKARIISFPGGFPGDIGLFLGRAPPPV